MANPLLADDAAPDETRRNSLRLKLLHVVPTYLPATRYGGPIYSVHGLCKALAAMGARPAADYPVGSRTPGRWRRRR